MDVNSKSDRVMLHKDSNCYCNNSICEFHKKCLSSIAYCHNHKKLSDIRNMCEGCLLSFVMEKESSDCDSYKSLVGILHKDLEFFVGKDIEIHLGLSNDYVYEETSKSQKCSCCGQPLKVKKFIRSKARKNAVKKIPKAPGPVPLLKVNSREKRKELSKSESDYSELEEDDNIPNKTTPLEDLAPNSPRCYYRTNMESTTEKTGLAPENSEASVSKEAGEAMLNLSSRQVHLDRKPLMALYMELDEERNASAVAANNAMAMIMRLQAEKAEIQMEALQYQRLMEEEVEHDEESLRKTKEMLLRKRKK
ncbi:hypothetical protein K1719_030434 [Acacia pycnantha]|nr:hypothetical protein K1719_030434 [Acacia pycnantha]